MKRKQYISALLALTALLASCSQKSTSNVERDEKREIVTQSDNESQNQTTEDSCSDMAASSETTPTESNTHSVVSISDHLLVIDTSDGMAGVYRIQTEGEPQGIQPTDDWPFIWDYVDSDPNEPMNWCLGDDIDWINITEDVSTDTYERYFPPEGIQFQTFDSIEMLTNADLTELQSLPGMADGQHIALCRYKLDLESYPPKKKSVSFLQQDKIYYYQVVPMMEDNIPLYGSFYTNRMNLCVYEWDGVIEPTIGSSIQIKEDYLKNGDKMVVYFSFPSYSITETIMEPQKLVTYQEALESIDEAVEYKLGERQARSGYVFAAELVYSSLSEFDQSTLSFVTEDEAVLFPVWRFYYYEQGGYEAGVAYVDINAITGKSMYSKEFPDGDEHFFSNGI